MRRVCFDEAKRTGWMCEDSSRAIPTLAFETLPKHASSSEGRLSRRSWRPFEYAQEKIKGIFDA